MKRGKKEAWEVELLRASVEVCRLRRRAHHARGLRGHVVGTEDGCIDG